VVLTCYPLTAPLPERIWWCQNQRRAFHATRKDRTGRADHPQTASVEVEVGRCKTVVEALKKIGLAAQSLETEGPAKFSEPNTMIFLAWGSPANSPFEPSFGTPPTPNTPPKLFPQKQLVFLDEVLYLESEMSGWVRSLPFLFLSVGSLRIQTATGSVAAFIVFGSDCV